MTRPYALSLVPERLWQAINPWTINMPIEINLGHAGDADLEREILDDIGSYGRQIGRIGDALEVLLRHFKPTDLTEAEQEALALLTAQLVEIRNIKQRSEGNRKTAST